MSTRRRKPPGATNRNGYGAHHQAVRARLASAVASGTVACVRCGDPIDPGQPWDLDHRDDRQGYNGAAHRSCNRAAGAVKMNERRRRNSEHPYRWSRRWHDDPPAGTVVFNGPSPTAEVCLGNGKWEEVGKSELDRYLIENGLA